MLSEQEVEQIKKQLLQQIESFPKEQRENAKEQILAMNSQELEEFLEKNKLIKQKGAERSSCIFCSIVKGEIPSYKIDENKSAIAVLELNPISKAHSIIIPKKHATIDKLPGSVLSLAKKLAKKIKSKMKAEEVRIETSSIHGHDVISTIPIYKDKKLERKKASDEELIETQKKLISRKRSLRRTKEKKQKELPQAPRRIP